MSSHGSRGCGCPGVRRDGSDAATCIGIGSAVDDDSSVCDGRNARRAGADGPAGAVRRRRARGGTRGRASRAEQVAAAGWRTGRVRGKWCARSRSAASARPAGAVAADSRDAVAALALVPRRAGAAICRGRGAAIVLAGRHLLAAEAAGLDEARGRAGGVAGIERVGVGVLHPRLAAAVLGPDPRPATTGDLLPSALAA